MQIKLRVDDVAAPSQLTTEQNGALAEVTFTLEEISTQNGPPKKN